MASQKPQPQSVIRLTDEGAYNYLTMTDAGRELLGQFDLSGNESLLELHGVTAEQAHAVIAEHIALNEAAANRSQETQNATNTTQDTQNTNAQNTQNATNATQDAQNTNAQHTQNTTTTEHDDAAEQAQAEQQQPTEEQVEMLTLPAAAVTAAALPRSAYRKMPTNFSGVEPSQEYATVLSHDWESAGALLEHENPFAKAVFAFASEILVIKMTPCNPIAIVKTHAPGISGKPAVKFVTAAVPKFNIVPEEADEESFMRVLAQGSKAELDKILEPGYLKHQNIGAAKGQLIIEASGRLKPNAPETSVWMPYDRFVNLNGDKTQWATIRLKSECGSVNERLAFMRQLKRQVPSMRLRLSGKAVRVMDLQNWTMEKKKFVMAMGVRSVYIDQLPERVQEQREQQGPGALDAAKAAEHNEEEELRQLVATAGTGDAGDLRVLSAPNAIPNQRETLLDRLRRVGGALGNVVRVFAGLNAVVVQVLAAGCPADDLVQVQRDVALTKFVPLRA